ncbi:MAG: hypothetical protein HXX16_09020 [Bacteroidales bacterium]|nr:hypothetical protein [Bacteroidales bacterium]
MVLRFFRQTLPQVIIVLIIIAILLWVRNYFSEIAPFYFDSIKMPFYGLATNWVSENIIYGKLITFTIILFTAFHLLQINSKHIVIKQRTYLPAFFYILITSCFIPLQRINPAIFSALIFVFVFDHIFSIYHKENALDNIFKAGFYIALASLFYAPSILYIIVLFLSIMSIRSFNIREWFAAFFGVITPWFFFSFYHYIINSNLTILFNTLNFNLFTPINHDNDSFLIYIFYGYCLILFFVTGFYLLKTLPTQKINVRKYYGIFFWFNLISIFALILIPSISYEIIFIAIIPISFQFAYYFTTCKRNFWSELLFLLLIAIAILMQFNNII